MELLERGSVRAELRSLLEDADERRGRLVFLGGEAGVGKSSLVAAFCEGVASRARVLSGMCDPLSTPRPLGPVLDMQEGLSAGYRTALALSTDRDVVLRGFIAELRAREATAVVVFEDVHWADEATLDLLRFVGRRLDGTRSLLIATYRSDEVGYRHPLRLVLGDLATVPGVRRISVEPLSPAAVRALAEGTGLDPVDLHARTGGNPFFATEVIAAGGREIPATVRDAVLARTARLPAGARAMLDAAAILGSSFERMVLHEVVADPGEAFDTLLGAGMLHANADRFAFRHELVREALLGVIPPHRARLLHRRVLEVLRNAPERCADPGRLAHHAEEAGDADSVLEFAPRAGRVARELSAHREAAAQFRRALRWWDRLPIAERAGLWEEYSWACVATSDWDEATRAGWERVALRRVQGDRMGEGRALSFLVGCSATMGRMADANEASRAAIAVLESLPEGPELAGAYGMHAYLQTLRHDLADARGFAGQALALAEESGGPVQLVMACTVLGSARILSGELEQESLLERALGHARTGGLHWEAAAARFNFASAWAARREMGRAHRCLEAGLAHAIDHELDGWESNFLALLAPVRLHLGRWASAEDSARRVASDPRSSITTRIIALEALGRLGARRGDAGATQALSEVAELALPTDTLRYVGPVCAARAEAAWLAGHGVRAAAEADLGLALALEKGDPWLAGELLFLRSGGGRSEDPPPWIAPPFALQIAGGWKDAAAAWTRLEAPYEAAWALLETSEAEPMRAALAEFVRLGAVPAERIARQRLRAAGVRGVPRGPRASTCGNPAQLTRREIEVVRLLAEGLPNREIARRLFVSPRTVAHHVSAVIAKLEVRSRMEAVAEAERRGCFQDGASDRAI
jgi:DNA-binding CsgD family transcriptional regulator/tetratricopeptide (TPR) repeat protein